MESPSPMAFVSSSISFLVSGREISRIQQCGYQRQHQYRYRQQPSSPSQHSRHSRKAVITSLFGNKTSKPSHENQNNDGNEANKHAKENGNGKPKDKPEQKADSIVSINKSSVFVPLSLLVKSASSSVEAMKEEPKPQAASNANKNGKPKLVKPASQQAASKSYFGLDILFDQVNKLRDTASQFRLPVIVSTLLIAFRLLFGVRPATHRQEIVLRNNVKALLFSQEGMSVPKEVVPKDGVAAPGMTTSRDKNNIAASGSSHLGTIVVAHGLNPLGMLDPRVQSIARAFASIGFTVITPEIKDFRLLRICELSVAHLGSIFMAIMDDPILCPSGRLSIFGASMSGSIGIISASDPLLAEKINAILCVGSFCSVKEAAMRAMQAGGFATSRNLLLYNFLHFSYQREDELEMEMEIRMKKIQTERKVKDKTSQPEDAFVTDGTIPEFQLSVPRKFRSDIIEAMRQSVLDLTIGDSKRLERFLQDKPVVAEEYWKIQNDVRYRMQHVQRILPYVEGTMDFLSPLKHIHNLRCRKVVLVHGEEDCVVPVQEARLMHESIVRLKAREHELNLDVGQTYPEPILATTGLITHGDRKDFRFQYTRSLLDILTALSTFISAASDDIQVLDKVRQMAPANAVTVPTSRGDRGKEIEQGKSP